MTQPAWILKIRKKLARPPRELAMFFATSIAARGIGITCQLLQVPIVVKTLGAEAFGLWMTLLSMANLVTFADFGVGIGVQNKVAESFARNEPERARALFGSALLFLAGVATLLAVGATVLASQLNYAAVFRLQDPTTIAEAQRAAHVFVLIFFAGFPLGLAQRLAFGQQRGWMFNATQSIGSVASLTGVALAAKFGASLPVFVACGQGAVVTGHAILLTVQFIRLGWWRRGLVWRFDLVKELLKLGAFFGVQQVLNTIVFALPALVISTQLGAAALTPYNLLQRLYNLFAVIQNAFMLPLWPAYSRAKARGEFAWMRRTLRRSLLATACFSITPMCVGAIFAGEIIHLWVGERAITPETTLVWLLFGWNALVFFQQSFSYLLAGVSEVRRTTYYSIMSAILSVSLMYLLVHRLGAPGVVLGLMGGFIPFSLVGNVLETFRYLRTASTTTTTPPPHTGEAPPGDELPSPLAQEREHFNAKA